MGRNARQALAAAWMALSVPAWASGDVAVGDVRIVNRTVELSGSTMTVTMDLSLDSLRLRSSRRLVLTPMVRGEGGNVAEMPQVVLDGRRQNVEYRRKGHRKFAPDVTEVRRRNGKEQSVHYSAVLSAEPWMRNSDIVLGEDLCGCGNALGGEEAPVWSLRSPRVAYVRPVAEVKTRSVEGSAYVDFRVDRTEIDPGYRRNAEELARIEATIDSVRGDADVTIDGVRLKGYASPESPYSHNADLARGRVEAVRDHVRNLYSFADGVIGTEYEPENWEGLRAYVEGSGLEHRTEILGLIDTEMDPDAKEARIRREYPGEYRFLLENCYPALRRTDYRVNYTVRGFSDVEEIRRILAEQPGKLGLDEVYLLAQTLDPGSDEFRDVFETAVRLFPDDWIANLNAACVEIERGDYESARGHLAKAGDNAHAWNAEGVMAVYEGDVERAMDLFSRAADAGLDEARENLGNLERNYR